MQSFVILTITIIGFATATDYCKKDLCSYSGPHIGCNNDGRIQCSNAEVVDLSNLKDKIVDKHNELRNKIASGGQSPYKSAAKMATMTWCNELASLALLNVKQCKMEHDRCHNTNSFKYSGQNLAWWAGIPDQGAEKVVLNAVNSWYSEYKNANNSVIQQFKSSSGKPYGHFTVMVADKNFKVGCASLKVKKNGWTEYYTACNYATTNIISQQMYEFGAPASKCQTGKNPKYSALCSVNEKYNVN